MTGSALVVALLVACTGVEQVAPISWEGTAIAEEAKVLPLGLVSANRAACGVHALFAASQQLNRPDLRLGDFLKPEYISSNVAGSSLHDLETCALDLGLQTRGLVRMSIPDLKAGYVPTVIQVRSRPWIDRYDHWVVILEIHDDGVTTYDPLEHDLVILTWPELAARWSGAALEVHGAEAHSVPLALMPSTMFLITSLLVIMTVLTLAHTSTQAIRLPLKIPATGLLLLGALWGIGVNAFSAGRLLDGPLATRDVDLWHTQSFIEYISPMECRRLVAQGEVQLVDARDQKSFAELHIDGAICIPVAMVEESVTSRISGLLVSDKPVVVYCSTEECPASAKVAQRLMWEGVPNVRVLKGGLEEWLKLPE